MKKPPSIQKNWAGGVDLLVERDAGNEILILTGKKENSLKFWKQMQQLAETAIDQIKHG